MKLIRNVYKTIDIINDWIGRVIAFSSLAILAIILCEVVLRRFFNKPQIWTMDAICMVTGGYVILLCGYGLLKKVYVSVDVFFSKLPEIRQHIIHLITYFVFLVPFTFQLVGPAFSFFQKAYIIGEKSYSVWMPPMWPVKFCLFLGLLLLCIQGISEILKQIDYIITHYSSKQKLASHSDFSVTKEQSGIQDADEKEV